METTVSSKERMTLSEYQKEVMRTCGQADSRERLAMAIIGIVDELAEVAGPIKKHLYHSHDLDREKMKDEIGDVCWYLALLCNTLGLSLEDVMEHNVSKLKRRYPDGFDSERSINRAESEV